MIFDRFKIKKLILFVQHSIVSIIYTLNNYNTK